jgi:hypothetical protein
MHNAEFIDATSIATVSALAKFAVGAARISWKAELANAKPNAAFTLVLGEVYRSGLHRAFVRGGSG